MKQVVRRLRDGRLELIDVPAPEVQAGTALVRIEASVVSPGTERATLAVAKKSLVGKARARPDQVRQVMDRVRQDGVSATASMVRQRLEDLGPMGYSAAGTVIEVSPEIRGFGPGDRVAVAGGGAASHAELDVVPGLLCAEIPRSVSTQDGAFATIGSIALHGLHRAGVEVGSRVAVIGLGLIGQLAVRIARASGCKVLGVDLDPSLVDLAIEGNVQAVTRSSVGSVRWADTADAVLICAASSSSDPIDLATSLARDRGTVVVVGDVAMNLQRAPFYEKELDLRLVRSYGPGRYDPAYEVHGLDYPIGHARWTVQRNMQAFLELVAVGAVRPEELVTHEFPFSEAESAFEVLDNANEPVVGVLLRYEDQTASTPTSSGASKDEPTLQPKLWTRRKRTRPRFAMIGAGKFATATLAPGLIQAGLEPLAVASAGGLSAESARRRLGFSEAVSDPRSFFERADIELVVIATRHDSHADLAAASLAAGKATYVEKPLALDWEGLEAVARASQNSDAPLFVGFNRRHAPSAVTLKEVVDHPRVSTYRVNAGSLPRNHWLNDLRLGGGRLVGEGCHFVDFLCDQARSDPVGVLAQGFPSLPDLPIRATDNFSLQMQFADGSIGNLTYTAVAPRGPGKERFETSANGVYALIDDFRTATIWRGNKRESVERGRKQEKGFREQFEGLTAVLRDGAPPPVFGSYLVSMAATLAAAHSLEIGKPALVVQPEL